MAQPRTVDKTGKSNGDERITVRFTRKQVAQIKQMAKKNRVSVGEFIRSQVIRNK
jgi:hypothetical protein